MLGLIFIGALILPNLIDCQTTVLRSAISPDGQYQANIESSICKDPTQGGTYLFVGTVASSSATRVKIFDNSTTDFELSWRWDEEVEVIYPRNLELFDQPTSLENIRIRYRSR